MNTRAPSTGTALSAAAGDRMGTQLIRSRKTVTHANTHISTPAYPHVPTTVGHSVTRAIATESPTSASASAPGTGSTSDSTAMHITNWGTLVEEIGPLESEEFLKQYHQLHENIRHQITQKQHKQSLVSFYASKL